jgi:hypothetical protein
VSLVGNRSRSKKKPPTYEVELRGVSSFTAVVNSRWIFLFWSMSAGSPKFVTSTG